MSMQVESDGYDEKNANFKDHARGRQFSLQGDNADIVEGDVQNLHRGLNGFHTSMIAIGGAIGAGLFVGAGGAFAQGGPASVLIGFIIISVMIVCVMQALGELATLYPQNGAFTAYVIRFIDPSWGFAMGVIYAISWLTVLPFELTAAGLTIDFWRPDINIGVWIAVFLTAMFVIQAFGVRAYGWTEVVLSMIKVITIIGFCIFAIINNAGGVPTDPRGYIGFEYWQNGLAFRNGFHGFCSVFVTAAFSFAGTELVGLTAAETKNPEKQLPRAIRQTVFRIVVFYLLSLLLVGTLVRADDDRLLNAGNSNTKDSIFVVAFLNAGVKGLPSVMNVVITLSVISVANSCTYGSTRTLQALAARGMLPKILAYVDKKGRPIPTILLQLAFAMLAFVNESSSSGGVLFGWLLALSAIAYFFVWGSICLAHIRFRMAWKAAGRSIDELPYKASMGVWGSYLGLLLNIVCLIASIYVGVSPITGEPFSFAVKPFFQQILAIPTIFFFYICYKIFVLIKVPEQRPMWVRISKIDVYEGLRERQKEISGPNVPDSQRKSSIVENQQRKNYTMAQRFKMVFTDLL
ncbi:unnamed protein product [Zymoseptoria tritici ST99CH_3D1]|uniref:Amino acid permease/ SLC12A domain-containing protein n=1 Tax=Zymoseptoria tritici ST99CH_1E4 TaxID=1276532 RepID=A0A2H1GG12_ZYMTR|nr:unnamed protein product [Zymoseptoria tritici ST99CH_1E4]SMR53678.1 unnamed protein product [Zymoseptoria tritici ST99CH_3D1]